MSDSADPLSSLLGGGSVLDDSHEQNERDIAQIAASVAVIFEHSPINITIVYMLPLHKYQFPKVRLRFRNQV